MLDSATSTVESVVTTLTSKCCSSCSLLLHLLEPIVSVSAFTLVFSASAEGHFCLIIHLPEHHMGHKTLRGDVTIAHLHC